MARKKISEAEAEKVELDTETEETSPARRRKKNVQEKNLIQTQTKRGIIAVIILGFGLLSLLGLIGVAGTIGNSLGKNLTLLFGWGTWFVPIIIWIIALTYYKSDARHFTRTLIGLLLSVLGASGLFNLVNEGDEVLKAVAKGDGGGYLGYMIGHLLYLGLGFWGSIVFLILLLGIGLIITLDASLEDIIQLINPPSKEDDEEIIKKQKSQKQFSPIPYPDEINVGRKYMSEDFEELDESETDFEEETEGEYTQDKPKIKAKKSSLNSGNTGNSGHSGVLTSKGALRQVTIPLNLLADSKEVATGGDLEINKLRIKRTLENFNIPVEMGEVNVGPTVTQYTLRPAEGIKVQQILTLNNDIALALAAHPLRIEAPIPGKSLVGIEVPNQGVATVRLKSLISSENYQHQKFRLPLAVGKDVTGNPWVIGLETMPHLLIAGATGSGKSVCVNSFIISLLYSNSPETLKLIMVDPKRVELTAYSDIPYLLTPVITENDKTVNALKWATGEMDNRYKLLAAAGKKNIESYNAGLEEGKLPYIVIIIDELADLMSVAGKEVEALIVRLAQMARAIGIHLILATQRPSVDVITGLIKANIPGRIAFTVNSIVDSRTILDSSGAEKLLGKGDMLFLSASLSKPKRLQGAYLSDEEIENVVAYVKTLGSANYLESVTQRQGNNRGGETSENDGGDALYYEARDLVIKSQKASASLLQRHLSIGYARAARLLDVLEENGVIGPGEGAKPREILVSKEEFQLKSDGGLTSKNTDSYDEINDETKF